MKEASTPCTTVAGLTVKLGSGSDSTVKSTGARVLRQAVPDMPAVDRSAYECVQTVDRLEHWVERAFAAGMVAIDTETSALDAMRAEIAGMALDANWTALLRSSLDGAPAERFGATTALIEHARSTALGRRMLALRLQDESPQLFRLPAAANDAAWISLHPAALFSGERLRGAALDVFREEPLPVSSPLTESDRTILTPHSLCWTATFAADVASSAIGAIIDVAHGQQPQHMVNPQAWTARAAAPGTEQPLA